MPFAEWMMSLKQPDHPSVSCCGPSDQYYATEYHEDPLRPGGFIVRAAEFPAPIPVPPEKVDWTDINPTGRGVIFVAIAWDGDAKEVDHVYCFVPGLGM